MSSSGSIELIEFLIETTDQIKKEISDLNRGCCGYLAFKIAEILIQNGIFSFHFGTIQPLWSKTGLKSFKHIWIEIEIDDTDTVKVIELNRGNAKGQVEFVKQFYMMPALKEAISEENKWAWGPAFTNENKIKINEKLAEYMKTRTLYYAKDCDNAGIEIGEKIYACKILSDQPKTVPFSVKEAGFLVNKWIYNIESGKSDIIISANERGVILMSSKKEISYVGLLERYHIGSDKQKCGKLELGKQIGCHTKVDCPHFKAKKR